MYGTQYMYAGSNVWRGIIGAVSAFFSSLQQVWAMARYACGHNCHSIIFMARGCARYFQLHHYYTTGHTYFLQQLHMLKVILVSIFQLPDWGLFGKHYHVLTWIWMHLTMCVCVCLCGPELLLLWLNWIAALPYDFLSRHNLQGHTW